ncbi:MAG: dTDP-4-dehydrorhamnose reductase, partial [Acidimicrobiales bacterium]
MRVLITGGAGSLGRDLAAVCSAAGDEVVATDSATFDVTDRDRARSVLGQIRPDVVINAAAYTDVDGCELNPDGAWRVNALGARHVAEASALVGARVCQVSTDYVFDGESSRPYLEWDRTNPLSVYGASKAGAEAEIRGLLGPEATIVRTSWLAGRHGRNFVRTMLELGRRRAEDVLPVVDDQHGCPTFTEDLAVAIRSLLAARRPGTFHVTNQGATTWYALARDAYALAGLDPARLRPITTAELTPPRAAPRPRFSVLDNAALRLSGSPLLADHHVPLERLGAEVIASGAGPGAPARREPHRHHRNG